jgi:hypothetical protein
LPPPIAIIAVPTPDKVNPKLLVNQVEIKVITVNEPV